MSAGVRALLQELETTLGVQNPGQLEVTELLDLLAKRGMSPAEVFAGLEVGLAADRPAGCDVYSGPEAVN